MDLMFAMVKSNIFLTCEIDRRSKMPFINIKVLKGTLSKEKKDEMIKRVSETVAQ
jgi:hypothetical protein